MNKFSAVVGVTILILCAAALGGPQTAPSTGQAGSTGSPRAGSGNVPTSQPVVVSLADKHALSANMGKEVVVEGTVSSAKWSDSGKVFLVKFKEGEATGFQAAVFSKFRETMEKAFNGDLSSAFEGAKVRISGKLQTYREHPEIVINGPSQITILAKAEGNPSHLGPATRPATPAHP